MNIQISEDLTQYLLKIKGKQTISLKELILLHSKISKERKWVVYVDFFMDTLFTFVILWMVNLITAKFEVNFSFFLKFLIIEIIFWTNRLFWQILSLYNLFKSLKTNGVEFSQLESIKIAKSFQLYNLLKITNLFYSAKTQKEIFEPIIADWQEEYFEALFKKEAWKARWINVRYTYAFLAAMWLKSPIGDLIEFVIKIAKH